MADCVWLLPLGLAVGAIGALVGAGGGFILVPVLLLAYPEKATDVVTSVSLAVVCVNAVSGSLAYAGRKRIDYRSGLLFAAATIPGAVLGALTTPFIPRRQFDVGFGVLLLGLAAFLMLRPEKEAQPLLEQAPGSRATRTIVDASGNRHTFAYHRNLGVVLSLFVGFFSSLLGIGGGFIHVPAMVHLLNFPVRIATATSLFILMFTALGGTVVHVVAGAFSGEVWPTVCLGAGAIAGAQAGARISERLHGVWLIRALAVALGLAGARLFLWR